MVEKSGGSRGRAFEFRKTHTSREIAQYVVDPDAPDLTLSVPAIFHLLKWVYVGLNISFTLASCGALIWLSFPHYVEYADPDPRRMNFLNAVELTCVLFFTIDYLVRIVLTNRKRRVFVRQITNMIDVLSTLPYFLALIFASLDLSTDLFRVFFVLRMVRVIRLSKYNPGMQLVINTVREGAALLVLFLVMVLLTIIITSTAFFFAERGEYDAGREAWMRLCPPTQQVLINGTWTERGFLCSRQVAPYQSIFECMYWSVVMMTTTGQRVERPVTVIGQIIAMVTSLMGVFFFAAPATVLATNYKSARKRLEAESNSRSFDQRATAAMKAQEDLRKELERVWKLRDNSGRIKFEDERVLTPVATFVHEGLVRTIFEAVPGTLYVYEPLVLLRRDADNKIIFTDDFNLHTAQRVVTCNLEVDSDAAREEARNALMDAEIIPLTATEATVLVAADPLATIQVAHDYAHAYPELGSVVHFDLLPDTQARSHGHVIPLRFVIDMPHIHAVADVIELLEQTRLHVSVGIRRVVSIMHIPLLVDNILATRLVRELYVIAHERKADKNLIAYIHPNDAAQLLEGFCSQFVPTPSSDVLVIAPELVDQQVVAALRSSFPLVKLDWIPPEGANSVFRSPHLNINSIHDSYVLGLNLTRLTLLDKLGYGNRFNIQVPVCEETRTEISIALK